MSASVSLTGLTVSFFGQTVLREVNALFPPTGLTVLVGRSGSGKSTLLRAINRLNEEFPGCRTTGRVTVDFGAGPVNVYDEQNLAHSGLSLTSLRMKLGMLFQTPNLFPVSAYKNMAMPLSLVGNVPQSDIPHAVEKALRQTGLWDELKDRLHTPAERLSGGQQQRLCLARLLALKPAALLLDEPTASLDLRASRQIEELLAELAGEYSVIMVSHNLGQARRMNANILVCESGALRETLTPTDPALEEKLLRCFV